MDAASAAEANNGISEARKKELEEIARLLWAQRKNGVTVHVGKDFIVKPLTGEPISFFEEES